MLIAHIILFIIGIFLIAGTLYSAVQTFVLPRSAPDLLTRVVFHSLRKLFDLRLSWAKTYEQRDAVMAFYAPVGLLMLIPIWYIAILIGYICVYWALGADWYKAFQISGSSLFTLGYAEAQGFPSTILTFTEAAIGLLLIALLIAYLPTMYAAFSRRESAVTLLEVRAGSPPSAIEMLKRYQRIHGLAQLNLVWRTWENWFADIEESHTSLPALVFFRSPRPDRSWITAAGAVLDAASLTLSSVDIPEDAQAALCIRAGYIALRGIADYFNIAYNPAPKPDDPISIDRAEFDSALLSLSVAGLPVKTDLESAWKAYKGWRVNYDHVLVALAGMVMAPLAPWSSDRAIMRKIPFSRNVRTRTK